MIVLDALQEITLPIAFITTKDLYPKVSHFLKILDENGLS
jgi:hypothetical protein